MSFIYSATLIAAFSQRVIGLNDWTHYNSFHKNCSQASPPDSIREILWGDSVNLISVRKNVVLRAWNMVQLISNQCYEPINVNKMAYDTWQNMKISYSSVTPYSEMVGHIDIEHSYIITEKNCEPTDHNIWAMFVCPVHFYDNREVQTSIYKESMMAFMSHELIQECFDMTIKIYPNIFSNKKYFIPNLNRYATTPEEAVVHIILHELGHLEWYLFANSATSEHPDLYRRDGVKYDNYMYENDIEKSCDAFASSLKSCCRCWSKIHNHK